MSARTNFFYRRSCEHFVDKLNWPLRSPRIIAFRFIPNSVVSRPVAAVWGPTVADPWNRLPRVVRYSLGWLALLAIVFGSAFGFSLPQVGPTCLQIRVGVWPDF